MKIFKDFFAKILINLQFWRLLQNFIKMSSKNVTSCNFEVLRRFLLKLYKKKRRSAKIADRRRSDH